MTWQLTVSGHPEDNSPEQQEAIADRAEAAVADLIDDEDLGTFSATFTSNDVSRDLMPAEAEEGS